MLPAKQAKKIADTMQDRKMKEIGIVRNRITLMEHLEQLTHKDLQRLDINVLKAAVHACSQSKCGVALRPSAWPSPSEAAVM